MDSVLGWSAADGWLRRHRRWADAAYAAVLAILLLPLTARTIWGSSWRPTVQVAALAGVLLAHGALAVRRSAPRAAFGVAGVLVLGLVLLPPIDPGPGRAGPFSAVFVPSVLVFPVALYTVAAWCPQRVSLQALVLSSAGAVVVLARLWGADYLTVAQPGVATSDEPLRSWPLFLVLGVSAIVLLPWWAGRHRRLRLLYVAELEERARLEDVERAAEAGRAVAEERRRIAREMHDVVAYSLSVLVTQAEGGRLMAAQDPAVTVPVLEAIARTGREAMQDMGSVLQVLDGLEDGAGAPERPQPRLAELPALVEQVQRCRPPGAARGARHPAQAEWCGGAHRLPGHPGGAHQRAQARRARRCRAEVALDLAGRRGWSSGSRTAVDRTEPYCRRVGSRAARHARNGCPPWAARCGRRPRPTGSRWSPGYPRLPGPGPAGHDHPRLPRRRPGPCCAKGWRMIVSTPTTTSPSSGEAADGDGCRATAYGVRHPTWS